MATPTVSVREWTDVVRRARLGRTVKHIAFTLATYADYADGTRVYPGLALLAVAAEVNYTTVKRAVAKLLQCGLIEIVNARPGVPNRGTEYRLVLALDLLDRVDVLSPALVAKEVEEIRIANRRGRRTGAGDPRTPGGQPVDNPEVQGLPAPVPATEVQVPAVPVLGEVQVPARPRYRGAHDARTSIDRNTTPTIQSSADLRTAVTVPGAPGRVDEPDPPKCSNQRCARGFALSEDGSRIERCPDPSHPPPDNVIPFARPA